jgi:O-antigen/teichoic acid export membrane protein
VASFQLGTVLVLQAKALSVLPLAPLLSAMSELASKRADEARRIYVRLEGVTFALAAVVLSAAFAFGPAFVQLWLGPEFAQAGHVVRLLIIAVAINVYVIPLGVRAFSEKAHRLPGMSALANVVVNGVLSVVLTWRIGLDGALIGSIAGNLTGTVVFLHLVRRRDGADWHWPSPRALCAGAVLALLLMLAHAGEIRSWPLLVAASGVYLLAAAPLFFFLERVPPSALFRAVRA